MFDSIPTPIFLIAALFILLGVFPGLAASQDSAAPTDKQNFHLFLLIGQSNMAGRGEVSDADTAPLENVLMLNKQNQWVPAIDPLHFDKPKVAGVGLGRSFAAEVAKANPDVVIGLIPCAVGATSITCWEPAGYHEPTKTHPYDDMLIRLREAMKAGTLKGILWHQGESDSTSVRSPPYESRLHALVDRLRNETADSTVPFIVGQLGQFKEKPWNEDRKRVDSAHRSLPEKMAHTAFVPSDGLNHKGDLSHFDSTSYRELGRRYAKVFLAMATAAQGTASNR